MSIGALAEELVLKHHSAVELAGRLEQAGLVTRKSDPQDKRRVLLALTSLGDDRLTALAQAHSEGLGKTRDIMIETLKTLPGGE
jgi:DNA-binding MarR family transcriptional regulator